MGGMQVGGGGGLQQRWFGWVFRQWGRWEKAFVQNFSNRSLKTLTECAVTTEAGSLFQYFTNLSENADPLLRRWLAPSSTLKGCPLRPRRSRGRKSKFWSISKRPLKILKAVIRSAQSHRRCREWRPSSDKKSATQRSIYGRISLGPTPFEISRRESSLCATGIECTPWMY